MKDMTIYNNDPYLNNDNNFMQNQFGLFVPKQAENSPKPKQEAAATKITVTEYCETYIASRPGIKSPHTIDYYNQILRCQITPYIGFMNIDELTSSDVRQWYANRRANASYDRAAKSYRFLNSAMHMAIEDGLIEISPCRIKGGGRERTKERVPATAKQVYQLAMAIDSRYRVLILTACYAAMRFGELAGLQRKDIDFRRKHIHVSRQIIKTSKGIYEAPPKCDSARIIDIPTQLVQELKSHINRFAVNKPTDHVFTAPRGGYLQASNFNRIWNKAKSQVKNLPDGFVFHDLRHTGATLAIEADIAFPVIQSRLGHSSLEAALRYQHATSKARRSASRKLNVIMESSCNQR